MKSLLVFVSLVAVGWCVPTRADAQARQPSTHLTQKNHNNALMIAAGLGSDRATDEFYQDRGTEADAIETIKLCLEQGLDLDAFNDNGETALHRATGEQVIRFLVAEGADLFVQNKLGKTPLQVAVDRKDRNGATRYPQAVTALRELSAAHVRAEERSR